jgi:hypothetical protein
MSCNEEAEGQPLRARGKRETCPKGKNLPGSAIRSLLFTFGSYYLEAVHSLRFFNKTEVKVVKRM